MENLTELDGDLRAAAKQIHEALAADLPIDRTKLAIEWRGVAAHHNMTIASFKARVALYVGTDMTATEVARLSRTKLSFLFTD